MGEASIDWFMAALSEWTARQSYRIANNPLAREVPPDEVAAYSRARRTLASLLSRAAPAKEDG
jgi:hypothetical protein